ncbi:MAG: AAA family ATPase [SAR324 cluster bacterium]|uniref:HTH-type transcriptional regulatory protein TyrR n=1 Tax=SAR324 cluster bacterium TaxID=2024889 RepID=A0A2A4SUT3_9DELT|nr:MAG: AAA family ATPase [SAR324 cluster bacterium]
MNELMDSVYNPIVAIDAQERVIFCNSPAAIVIGASKEQIFGQPLRSFVPHSKLHRVLQTGKTEISQKFKLAGKTFLANQTVVKVEEQVIGAIAILQDISDLESISMELKHTKLITEELNTIIESSFDGIFLADGTGKTLRVNRAYERITGIKKEEILERQVVDLIHEGFFNKSATLQVLSQKRSETVVQTLRTGKKVMVTGNPIFDKEGEIVLVVANVRDVSELNQLQQEMQQMDKLQSETEIELQELRESVKKDNPYVIRSKKMQEIHHLAMRLAQVDSTVLILGESGVGKEIVAELIHRNGKRKNKPFIKISCAAIPESLLESELFGYAPGSFTGAQKGGKAGIFEMAQGGSLFLDEIGEISLPLQAKLLRVLQDKEFTRIGTTRPMKADVRIITATNRDLEAMVQQKLFRQDLFFRLNVVPVLIPPLRERREAILPFIHHFLRKQNERYNFDKQIAPAAIDLLTAYDWPGNVRELENMIERMVVTTLGKVIQAQELPEAFHRQEVSLEVESYDHKSLQEIMEYTEKRVLKRALEKYKTTRQMARVLEVNQSTIVRKLKKYQLNKKVD